MSLFRYVTATKWTAKALLIAYATYACHHEIEKAVNTVEFYFSKSEPGYVRKEQALNLEIVHELNGKGNLETYVKNYSQRLPVYIRENGIIVGDSDYNISNLTEKERSLLVDIETKKANGYYDE
ncbi:hypothetical protein J4476_00405 [Candidatus Woesearchaeota archaeon]|nr:MAG: hypothetical protein QT09_C0001G0091 [archaeon GW2011_AR18]MBS3161145.1 hypothetical protein [Candidatus Woesearchaeota archaeon]HIH26364.1 hypothetical protein [Nanoarchaeota archaeon]